MIDAPLAFAFGTGMLATVNPCGFAMLPAYLGYFLSADGKGGDKTAASHDQPVAHRRPRRVGRLPRRVQRRRSGHHPPVRPGLRLDAVGDIVIGVVLGLLGLAMLRGYEPSIRLPKLDKGGRDTTFASMFVFGMSYAIASVSCSLPLFTATVVGTFRRTDLRVELRRLRGLRARDDHRAARPHRLDGDGPPDPPARSAQGHAVREPGVGSLLLVVGAYLVHYGWYERRVQSGSRTGSGVVDLVTGWSQDISTQGRTSGTPGSGLLLALGLSAVLAVTFGLRGARSRSSS